MNITFRSATHSDIPTLADFNCRLAMETEGRQLDSATVQAGVTRGLDVGEEVRYFVADADGQVVGQIMLTREWSDWRDGWIAWLQSVYVVAEARGKGVFKGLLQHAIDQLKQQPDVVCMRLYVERDNNAAIATYQKLNFADSGYHVMETPLQ